MPFQTVALTKFSELSENAALNALAEKIGQVELTVTSLFEYQEISTWGFVGDSINKLGGAITAYSSSPATGWSKNYIQISDSGEITNIDCGRDAIQQYLETIQRFDLYPFPYYVLSVCQKNSNQPEWKVSVGKAYKILSITTKIPGHNTEHDMFLNLLSHN